MRATRAARGASHRAFGGKGESGRECCLAACFAVRGLGMQQEWSPRLSVYGTAWEAFSF